MCLPCQLPHTHTLRVRDQEGTHWILEGQKEEGEQRLQMLQPEHFWRMSSSDLLVLSKASVVTKQILDWDCGQSCKIGIYPVTLPSVRSTDSTFATRKHRVTHWPVLITTQ